MKQYIKDKFYVYVYLDPTKFGLYKYEKLSFVYEPFYVGKGFGNRDRYHLNAVYKNHATSITYNKHKFNKIKKLIDNDLEPIIIRIEDHMSESDALDLEMKIIRTIGRRDLNEGTLVNMTDGGEGSTGFVHSKESKEKMSISTSLSQMGEKNPFYGKRHCAETINNMKKKLSNLMSGDGNPFYGKRHNETAKNKMREARKKKYKLIDPDGNIFIINGIQDASDKYNLHIKTLQRYFGAGKIPTPKMRICQSKINTVDWQIEIID